MKNLKKTPVLFVALGALFFLQVAVEADVEVDNTGVADPIVSQNTDASEAKSGVDSDTIKEANEVVANMGGAAGANASRLQTLLSAAVSGIYATEQFSICFACSASHPCPKHCIKGALGVLQAGAMLGVSGAAGRSAAALLNGTNNPFTFNPTEAGLCLDASSGCTPGAIDEALSGYHDAFKTGQGYDEANEALKNKALEQLKTAEKLGFKLNRANGTITDPNGKVTKFDDIKMDIPSSLSKAASDKLAGIQKAQGVAAGSRGLASTGTGGVIFKDEYIGGVGLGGKKKRKPKDKSGFLAGLSDKDAKGGVGFAGDSIFGMIQRRYNKKLKAQEFIGK